MQFHFVLGSTRSDGEIRVLNPLDLTRLTTCPGARLRPENVRRAEDGAARLLPEVEWQQK